MRIGTASRGLWPAWQPARIGAIKPGRHLTLAPRARTVSSTRVDSSSTRRQLWKWRLRPPFQVSRPGPLQRHGAEPPARKGLFRGTDPDQPGRPRPEAPGRRSAPRAPLHHPVGQRVGEREELKKSSSASSSHKKKKSSSSSSRETKKRARDRSPHRSPAQSSLPGLRSSRVEASGPLPSPPRVGRTPVPSTPVATGVIPVDPRTRVPSASRPALGPGTPAGGSLPALPLPQEWQMQLYQLQAMASVPYTFPGQHPCQPPGFGAGDVFSTSSVSQSSAPAPSVTQADHPTPSAYFGRDPPSDLSHEEWEMVRRLRNFSLSLRESLIPGPSSLLLRAGSWRRLTLPIETSQRKSAESSASGHMITGVLRHPGPSWRGFQSKRLWTLRLGRPQSPLRGIILRIFPTLRGVSAVPLFRLRVPPEELRPPQHRPFGGIQLHI